MEILIPIFMFMSIAAVLILRPLTKRLGLVLEMMSRDRQAVRTGDDTDAARLRIQLDHVLKRLELMEERVDFTERLIASSRRTTRPQTDMSMSDGERLRFEDRQPSYLPR